MEKKKEWPYRLLGLLLLIGLGIALHLTWHHENSFYGDSQAKLGFCPENAVINCDVVNTSRFSEFLGIPIALFAIPTYLFLLALILFRNRFSQVPLAILGVGLATTTYSLFLAGVSYFEIGYGCLWCMGLYTINLATLVVGFYAYKKDSSEVSTSWGAFLRFALPSVLVLALFSVSTQKMYRATLQKRFVAAQDLRQRTQAELWKAKSFRFATSFQKPGFTADKKVSLEVTDLQPLVGNGKPLAIVYQYPGFIQSDSFAPSILKLLKQNLPQAQVFVAIGVRNVNRLETFIEDHYNQPEMRNIPLLFDVDFANLKTLDLPSNQATLLLIGSDGSLLSNQVTKISQTTPQWLARVSKGDPDVALMELKALSNPEAMIGNCAPSVSLTNLVDQKLFNFKPQALKKPTLLVFWSATCGHCRSELPKLIQYHRTRKNDLDIVTITRARPQRKVSGQDSVEFTLEYAKSIGLTWPILSDSGIASYLYRTDSTPTSILISPSGSIEKYWKGQVHELESVYDSALRNLATSSRGTCRVQESVSRQHLDFSFQTKDGAKTALPSMVRKPTLVHFWATWCLPCQEELPHFLKFAKEQKNKGVDSLLITVETPSDKEKVMQFLKPYGVTEPVYFAPSGGIYDSLNNAYSVPRTYLVNSKSEVLKKYLGAQEWQNDVFQELVRTWFQNEF